MKNYKTKFLKVFLPCASLILAEIILVLLIQWVLFDKHTGESRYINNIWLAFTVGIAGSIISYYFTKKLKVSNKENYNGKGDWRLVFALLTGYFFGLTMCCENVISDDRFMRLAISDIRIIKNIDEIDTEYIDDYYYLDNLKIDTNAIGIYKSWRIMHNRGQQTGTDLELFAAVPICDSANSTTTKFWLSIKFDWDTRSIFGQIEADYKFKELETIWISSLKKFSFKSFPYLYIDKSTYQANGSYRASKRSTKWDGISTPIILRMRDQSPKELLKTRIIRMIGCYLIGITIFGLLLLVPQIQDKYATE